MTDSDKKMFDGLNKYTYLFRLTANNNGLSIVIQSLSNGQNSYHLCYNNAVLASLVITENDILINIYKYFKLISKRVNDACISAFFDTDRFRFDDFAKYCDNLKKEYDNLDSNEPVQIKEETETERLKKENFELRMKIDQMTKKIFDIFIKM